VDCLLVIRAPAVESVNKFACLVADLRLTFFTCYKWMTSRKYLLKLKFFIRAVSALWGNCFIFAWPLSRPLQISMRLPPFPALGSALDVSLWRSLSQLSSPLMTVGIRRLMALMASLVASVPATHVRTDERRMSYMNQS